MKHLDHFFPNLPCQERLNRLTELWRVLLLDFVNVIQLYFKHQMLDTFLAFSLIMLNTDAHNANIPKERKMTKPQFISNNRGINNGKDLPKEFLESLYDKIVSTPFAMSHERDEFSQWDKQGWLSVKETKTKDSTLNMKKKTNLGRKLWCIISACCLYLFEQPTDKKTIPHHSITQFGD